jgi:tRNA (cmo5U34)-methyltransferase
MVDSASRFQDIERVFQDEADEWHALARRYQTRYDEMQAELVSRVRVRPGARILDLGSGSGVLAELVLDAVPEAHVTLLDLSSNMLAAAERRLSRFGSRAQFVVARFEEMPPGPYDAVVSTLALHHLESDEDKRALYTQILEQLTPGGCFWQAEYVLSSTPADSAANEEAWGRWLATQGFTAEEIAQLHARVAHNDRPATLMDQLRWLGELGYERVDCTWRYIKFAVFGGYRPDRPAGR